MRLAHLLCAAAVSVAMTGVASAITIPTNSNLVTNGNFAATSPTTTVSTEFGTASFNGFTAQQFISGWTGNAGYEIWYPNAVAASTEDAFSVWGQGSDANTGKEMLYGPISAPPGATAFVGLDGDQQLDSGGHQVQSSIGQEISGLISGHTYQVTFDWAGAQMQSRTGATTEQLQVSLGSQSLDTSTLNNASEGFTGWKTATLDFTANSPSEWLSFLSVGTPASYPPMALLTNVSMSSVPEPASLALFGAGLLALGGSLALRRRSQRTRA